MDRDGAKTKRLANIGMLASTVAHELRNPLSVIQTAVFNIKRKRVNKDIDKHLANIEKKLYESTQIINNLLMYAKIGRPDKQRVHLDKILEEAVYFSKKRFPVRHIDITKDIKSVRDIFINADPVQINELFANILNNAFQATSRKEKAVIKVTAAKIQKSKVLIEIEDNGVTMNKQDIEKAFDPFFSTKAKGVGLGLAICAEIINLHDGDIEIESVKDGGTRLKVTLPIAKT